MNLSEFSNRGLFFLHNIEDIVVASTSEDEATTVIVAVDHKEIFREDLYPGADGRVVLEDVPSLLAPYVTSCHHVSINNYGARVLFASKPIRALYDGTVTVGEWLAANYLSPVRCKTVSDEEPICLAAANLVATADIPAPFRLNVTGAYYQDGMYQTRSAHTEVSAESNIYDVKNIMMTFDGVRDLLAAPAPLVGFTISLNDRLYKFFRMKGYPAITLRWRNCFGQAEYLSLQGKLQYKPEVKYTTGIINGVRRNIDAESEMVYTMQTGPINDDTRLLLLDMVESREVYLSEDGLAYPITIEDSDLTRSTDRSELQGAQFTFRRSKDRGAYIESFKPTERIFSGQFDWSYN